MNFSVEITPGNEIFQLCNPPHLLKCTRNLLLDIDLHFVDDEKNHRTRSWFENENVYEYDSG